jgi:DNA polymerase-3 subunit gamma/tau
MVGQEPVVRTLRNAVTLGKVHHAYLFVGSRGTGKTSTAKILAACLNCEKGPTVEPCGVCESCRSIAGATSLDVQEMDAASNNSVDDIRELRESVVFAPLSGRHKVYILDEAHMLSQAAWNAFLKTLEEPPPATVFVLATTEAQKVPATVVDRCHRFDFHRPTVEQIASVIRRTAQAEQIEIPPQAVVAIARAATGSFRDALGTLEQLTTYSGKEIQLEDVLAVLGVVDSELLVEVFDAVGQGDPRRVLIALASGVDAGRDAGSFASDLEVRARELLIVQSLGEVPGELSLTPESDARLAAQASSLSRSAVVRMIELLAGAMEAIRAGADSRTQLELAIVKAAAPEVDSSTQALLARIERLEGKLSGAPASVSPSPPPLAHRPATAPPAARVGEPELAGTPAPEPPREEPQEEPPLGAQPAPETPVAAPSIPVPAVHSAPPVLAPSDIPSPMSAVEVPAISCDLESIAALWPAVVDLIRSENGLVGALLADARPVALNGEDLVLAFAPSDAFLKKKAEDPGNRALVITALQQLAGLRLRISYELREELSKRDQLASKPPSAEDLVSRLMAEFDAEELPRDPAV